MPPEKVRLSLLPDLRDADACAVDLNALARETMKGGNEKKSPFLEPGLTEEFLDAVNRRYGVAYTFGGYLEDRRDLWRGSYLKEDESVHLGIDINVPVGTAVSVTTKSHVEKIIHDTEQDGGWGTVVFLRPDRPVGEISHFLYAHLSRDVSVKAGDVVLPGDIVGRAGESGVNGGWYPHIHVQAMTRAAWSKFGSDLKQFDGYAGHPGGKRHPLFPDPRGIL
jgi:murein DD-endopeptidase MepM/ murein hydrolase activator NlpD